jgi:kynurenine formamidase
MEIAFEVQGVRLRANLADPLSIAIPLDFGGPQPNHFGAPRAVAQPLAAGAFTGDTRAGGSVNCESLTLVPHCNGTHTECLGHVTEERVSVAEVLRGGLALAALVSVAPVGAGQTGDSSLPRPQAGDHLVTAQLLAQALASALGPHAGRLAPQALVVRTLPNDASKLTRRYGDAPLPAYFSAEAASWLVEQSILHLVTDLPSLDRSHDEGRLTAHRLFWGLPPGGRRASEAVRGQATVTELAWIAPTVRDGLYLLDLQLPPFLSDAAPSRPVLYPARAA